MALCDQGYLCEVCGEEVEGLVESDLYLRYVLGEVDPEKLHQLPERHILCNPTLAQFIMIDGQPFVTVEGPFGKDGLDPAFVAAEEARVTQGYHRLQELTTLGVPIVEYPLPDVLDRWRDPDSSVEPAGGNPSVTRAATTASARSAEHSVQHDEDSTDG